MSGVCPKSPISSMPCCIFARLFFTFSTSVLISVKVVSNLLVSCLCFSSCNGCSHVGHLAFFVYSKSFSVFSTVFFALVKESSWYAFSFCKLKSFI